MQAITSTIRPFTAPALAMHGAAAMARRPASEAGVHRTFTKGEELYAEGEAADFFYKVISGTVRICKVLNDGRRQIESFHLAGDMFGLECGAEHRFTAEAIDDLVVVSYRSRRIDGLIRDNPDLGSELMTSVMASLDRARDHMVLLGRKSAREKIASFLLDIAGRLTDGDRFDLPMQRTDIADHLGLTIETVSRTLTQMARDGLITLAACGRSVVLSDRESLEALEGA